MNDEYLEPGRSDVGFKGQPAAPAQQSLKGAPTLQSRVAAKDYELREKKHQNRFRLAMLFGLPILTAAWLFLIAWTILTSRISGIQAGIALGVTGVGLLTLLGLQIGWAYSRPTSTDTGLSGRVFKTVTKHSVE